MPVNLPYSRILLLPLLNAECHELSDLGTSDECVFGGSDLCQVGVGIEVHDRASIQHIPQH